MIDDSGQQFSPSRVLLFTALFLISFGVSGLITSAPTPVSANSVQAAAQNAKTVIVQKDDLTGTIHKETVLVASVSAIAAREINTDFLSEVTETASPSATPSRQLIKPVSLSMRKSFGTATPSATSTVRPAASLNGDVVFDLVNKHRVTMGKPALIKDESLCTIVRNRAPEAADELYGGKKMHSGFYALNLPYWATENIAAYASEEQTVRWWLSDYIHKKAIESDATHSCAACSGRYCSQIFTRFVKK